MARETEDEGMLVEWWLGFFGDHCMKVMVGGWAGCVTGTRFLGVGSCGDDRELTWMARGLSGLASLFAQATKDTKA